MMIQNRTRRCVSCDTLKGFQSFEIGKEVCKSCTYIERERKWIEEGIVTYRTCYHCGERKNLFIDYHKNGNYRRKASCSVCCAIYAKKYHNRSYRCLGRFEFDGKIWCKTCEQAKRSIYFIKDRTTCRECLGLTPIIMKFKGGIKPFKPMSKEDIKERENRLVQKQIKREKFVRKFNEKMGVSA